MKNLTFEDIRQKFNYEQVINFFKIPIDSSNKISCPFHQDDTPSHVVNENFGHCFGCGWSGSTFNFVQQYLKFDLKQTFLWFETTKLPDKSKRTYAKSSYDGPVNPELVSYWQSLFKDYDLFKEQRLLEPEILDWYQIGYRPDWNAWSIPFWRGLPGQSEVDSLIFRKIDTEPKYLGLKGHNRATCLNAHLLEEKQDYILVLFGSFDSMLALQDGMCAVGLNRTNPGQKDLKRLKEMFKKQSNIIIIPDNSPQEFNSAYKFADLVKGTVKFFPRNLPEGTDYIDYRLKHSVLQFEYEVLERLPDVHLQTLENCVSLVNTGDKYGLLKHYILNEPIPAFLAARLSVECNMNLWNVKNAEQLVSGVQYALHGGW